jgi:hypothetical protein
MATIVFPGTGALYGEFTVNDVVVSVPLLQGEHRLYTAFPYPTLERWRQNVLAATATLFELPTQCRTAVLFAHEADMGTVFFELTQEDPDTLLGYYNFKKKADLADRELTTPHTLKTQALQELYQQRIPEQYITLIQQRLDSAAFGPRVTGMCAAVYLTALLLEEAEAIV